MKKKAARKTPRRPFAEIRDGKFVIQRPVGTPSVSPAKIRAAVRKVVADRGSRVR